MPIIAKSEYCTGCGACESLCHSKAITLCDDEYGVLRPFADMQKCTDCGLCVKLCPADNKPQLFSSESCYIGCTTNEEIRNRSASGGICRELYEYTVTEGGYAVGAGFENKELVFRETNNINELSAFSNSKYVLCKPNGIYSRIKLLLSKGESVMFVGCPCQCAALVAVTGRHKNLLIIDLICHGVPPLKHLQDYIKTAENKKRTEICDISFRKNLDYRLEMLDKNGKCVYIRNAHTDPYYIGFVKNVSLRSSCYNCAYAQSERVGDITLGDYWVSQPPKGFEPAENGISMILINTENGKNHFEKIKDKLKLLDITRAECIAVNGNLRRPTPKNELCEAYFEEYKKSGITSALTLLKPLVKQNKKALRREKNAHRIQKLKRMLGGGR